MIAYLCTITGEGVDVTHLYWAVAEGDREAVWAGTGLVYVGF